MLGRGQAASVPSLPLAEHENRNIPSEETGILGICPFGALNPDIYHRPGDAGGPGEVSPGTASSGVGRGEDAGEHVSR